MPEMECNVFFSNTHIWKMSTIDALGIVLCSKGKKEMFKEV